MPKGMAFFCLQYHKFFSFMIKQHYPKGIAGPTGSKKKRVTSQTEYSPVCHPLYNIYIYQLLLSKI